MQSGVGLVFRFFLDLGMYTLLCVSVRVAHACLVGHYSSFDDKDSQMTIFHVSPVTATVILWYAHHTHYGREAT